MTALGQKTRPARQAFWSRAQVLTWIMTRRLSAVREVRLVAPLDKGSRRKDRLFGQSSHDWAVDDTLRRDYATGIELKLPAFEVAQNELALAERKGLSARPDGLFPSEDIRGRWPSPYGRSRKRGVRIAGGASPKPYNESVLRVLTATFIREAREEWTASVVGPKARRGSGGYRQHLKDWVAQQIPSGERSALNFSDHNRWADYIRRAAEAAITDTRLRQQCRCPHAAAKAACAAAYGRPFCFSAKEAEAILKRIATWRARGPVRGLRKRKRATAPT